MLLKRLTVVAVVALLAASPAAFAAAVTSITPLEENPTNLGTVKFLVTFDAGISGGSTSNFSLTTSGVTGASITGVTGSGDTRTITVNSGSGTGTIKVNLANGTGMSPAPGAYSNGHTLDIDKTAPTVTSITRLTDATSKLDRVSWKVTFSERMRGGSTSNFSVYSTGLSGASVTGILGNGIQANQRANERYVTAGTGTGDTGSIRLDLSTLTGLTDLAGNTLSGTYSSGETYTISRATKTGQTISNQTFSAKQSFSNYDYVTISHCTFQNISDTTALEIINCGDVKILDCTFSNLTSSSWDYGAAISGSGNDNIDIFGCDVINVISDTPAIKFPIGTVGAGKTNSDIRIDDLYLDGVNENGTPPFYASIGVRVFQANMLRVTNSEISYCSGTGIALAQNRDGNLPNFPWTYRTYGLEGSETWAALIEGNYIHHNKGETISSQAYSFNVKISDNELSYTAYDGYGARRCELEDQGCGDHNIYWQGPGVHIVDNYFHHNLDGVDGSLLSMRTNGLIERNIFSNGSESAFNYFNDHDCDNSYLLDIRNNVAYDMDGRGFSANAGNGSLYYYVGEIKLYHNTIVTTPGAKTPMYYHYAPVWIFNWSTACPVSLIGNILNYEGQTGSSQYYAFLESAGPYWKVPLAQSQNLLVPYSYSESAVFANAGASDYHLKSGSPAINGASLYNWVSVDVTGAARDSVDDIGGYEYSGGGGSIPTLSSITPNNGTTAGGTACTLTGTNFVSGATVSFGGTAGTGVVVDSSTQIRCTSPAHSAGGVSVTVTTSNGTSGSVTYTYNQPAPTLSSISPTSGSTSGGTACTLAGADFISGATVSFGGTAATGVTVDNSAQIRCTSPAGSGTVGVTVTTSGGTSGSQNFTYTGGGSSTTLLTDGFETNFDKWTDGGATDWTRVTAQKHSGSYSATAGPNSNDLFSDNLNASSYGSMTISFWYRDDDIDSGDGVALQLFDGTAYDAYLNLNLTTEDTWTFYTVTLNNAGADAQYFISNFRIKFEATGMGSGENLWIDDVNVVASGSAPVFPTLSSINPGSGSTGGGTACTLTGANLTGCSAVSFGGAAATGIVVDSSTQVRCTSPAGSGTVSVTATTSAGTSNGVSYTYTGGDTYYTATLIASDATMTASVAGGTNYNGYNNMQTLNDGGQNYYAIMKFSLSGLSGTSVTSAKLRVNIMNAPASHDADLWQTTDSWAEGTVTWSSQPAKGTLIQTLVVSGAGYKEFDCTSYVAGQFSGDKVVSFYITDNDTDNVWVQWNTEEATNYEPKLVVITQ